MKIFWEGDVKPTHFEKERKKFSILDYCFAGDVRYDSAKPLHPVQNPVHGGCSSREEVQFLLSPLPQTCLCILGRGESKLTKSVQTFCVFNFCSFQEIFTGLSATDHCSQDSSALRDFHISACKLN